MLWQGIVAVVQPDFGFAGMTMNAPCVTDGVLLLFGLRCIEALGTKLSLCDAIHKSVGFQVILNVFGRFVEMMA